MLTEKFQNAFNQLKGVIDERKNFEATHPWEPYSSYKTTIDYTDELGTSLLHYAAAMGDLDTVKYCLAEGADINLKSTYYDLPAIGIALRYGHVNVADYLFNQNAKCHKVDAHACGKTSKEWFNQKIKDALHQAFPDPKKNFMDASFQNSFFYQTKMLSLKTFAAAKPAEEYIDSLTRAAEIGELEFIKEASTKQPNKVKDKLNSLLNTAAANGQLNVIEWALAEGAAINGSDKYSESALENAIKYDQAAAVDYLLKHGGNVNKQNNCKYTPLMIALLNNSDPIPDILQRNPDIALTDVDDNNLLHHLASQLYETKETYQQLLSHAQTNALLTKKNIYGFTPIDIAIQKKNEAFLQIIMSAEELSKIKNSPEYGISPIPINQSFVRQKMYQFLKSQYRDVNCLNKGGSCNGFSYLHHLYVAQGKEDYFFSTLELMSNWDGKESSLFVPFKDIPQAKYYKNLAELFEQWINDVVLFQLSQQLQKDVFINLQQSSRIMQYFLVNNQKNNDFFPVYLFDSMDQNDQPQSLSDYTNMLAYFLRMPAMTHFELGGNGHITSAYKNMDGVLNYYDCNFRYRTTTPADVAEMLKRFVNYKYIQTGEIGDECVDKKNITPEIRSFIFRKDIPTFEELIKQFQVFSDFELPKSKEDSTKFQDNSHNRYSPLHIAVITSSIGSLKKLLDEDTCDVNARDSNGLSAVDISIKNNRLSMITKVLLDHPKVELNNPPVSPYLTGSIEFAQMLIDNKNAYNLENLLYSALRLHDFDTIEKIVVANKVDINKPNIHVHSPLMAAIQMDEENVVNLFLQHNANVMLAVNPMEPSRGNVTTQNPFDLKDIAPHITPMRHVIEKAPKYFPILVQYLQDINELDPNGRAAIHWAALSGKPDILNDLLKLNADPNLKTHNNENVFDLLNDYRLSHGDPSSWDTYCACLKLLLPVYKFNLADDKDQKQLQMLLYDAVTSDPDLFKVLLQKCNKALLSNSPSVNIKGVEYDSLLHAAIAIGSVAHVKLLLEAGIDINAKTVNAFTFLLNSKPDELPHKYELIQLFLQYDTKSQLVENQNKRAIELVEGSGDEQMKEIFIDKELLRPAKIARVLC